MQAVCLSCYYIQLYTATPGFLASAPTGLMGSFLPNLSFYDQKKSIAAIYSDSFAGMCSMSLFTQAYDVLILCLFVGVYLNILSPYFRGIGGKLGTIGFVSSLSFYIIKRVARALAKINSKSARGPDGISQKVAISHSDWLLPKHLDAIHKRNYKHWHSH